MNTTTRKLTKREHFTDILNGYDLTAEHKAFIEHELELLARKNASASSADRKPTAQQLANEALKANILSDMEADRLYAVGEMIKELPSCTDLSSSKVTSMLTQLKNEGKVIKTEDKRKSYYSKV